MEAYPESEQMNQPFDDKKEPDWEDEESNGGWSDTSGFSRDDHETAEPQTRRTPMDPVEETGLAAQLRRQLDAGDSSSSSSSNDSESSTEESGSENETAEKIGMFSMSTAPLKPPSNKSTIRESKSGAGPECAPVADIVEPNKPTYEKEETNASIAIENDVEEELPVHRGVFVDADSSRDLSYKNLFEESMVFSEIHNKDRKTMKCLIIGLVCAIVILAAIAGGLVGVYVYKNNDAPVAAPAPTLNGEAVSPNPPVAEATPAPSMAPVATATTTSAPVATVASTSAPVASPEVTVTTDAPVASAPTFGGGAPTFGGGGTSSNTDAPVAAPTESPVATVTLQPVEPSMGDTSFVTNPALFGAVLAASSDEGVAVSTPGSPQNQAYLWLENDTFTNSRLRRLQSLTDERKLQRYALACLYFSTGGDNWNRKDGWLQPTDECTWHTDAQGQVNCDTDNRIRILQFATNNVQGVLPPELSILTSLVTLVMDNVADTSSGLTGGIPASYGAFTSLDTFRLHGQKFTEPLPDDLFASWNVVTAVDFFDSEIPGQIPNSIGRLTGVTRLLMSDNKFTGTIPTSIGLLTDTLTLSLENNKIRGKIPTELGLMTSVTGVFLQDNQLTGTIPSEISNMVKLKSGIDFSKNLLTGPIPDSFAELNRLRGFIVNNNKLTGAIPSSLSATTNMRQLNLQENNLIGAISVETCAAIASLNTNEALVDCNEVACDCCGC